MQILTWYFERSVVLAIKISPELNADFECPHPKLEICHKSQQVFATQKVFFLYVYRITSIFHWRNLTFYVSYCRDECRKLSEMIHYKIPSQSKKR